MERENQRTNVTSVDIEGIQIYNARSQKTTFSFDVNGFEFKRFEPKTKLLGNDEATAESFLEEICLFLEDRFNTPHVFPYDLRIRSTEKNQFDKNTAGARMIAIPPAPIMHIDLTRKGANSRMQRHLHDSERGLLLAPGNRVLIVNTWMPLENPAVDYPLILGDRTTFLEDDIIAADQILPDFLGEFAHPRYKESQVWYWLNNQAPGEMTLFSSFDSNMSGNTGGCAHGTFRNPLALPNSPSRKSVETRSIVIIPRVAKG